MADYIDIREFKKNNQKKNHLCMSFACMTYEVNKQYLLCDLPDNILVTRIAFIAQGNLINGGTTTTTPDTAALKYIDNAGVLQPFEQKYYKNAKSLVLDVGGTEFIGAILITYVDMDITTGFYS